MEEAVEPDPYIIQLNEDLVKCDDYLSSSLPSREHKWVQDLYNDERYNVHMTPTNQFVF